MSSNVIPAVLNAVKPAVEHAIGYFNAGGPAYSASFLYGTMPAGYTTTRASVATYFDSTGTLQTAAINQPRLDYDPVTLLPRGVLIEIAATNFLLNSAAPATQTTASLSNGTYVLWMFGSGSVTSSANTAVGSGFGVATGGAAGTPGSFNTFTITTPGTVNITVSGSPTRFQLELNQPSSFITTTGATATRANDVISMTSIPWFNAVEGTLYVNATSQGSVINRAFCHFDDGTSNNAINFLMTPTQNLNVVRVTGSAQANIMFSGIANYTTFKQAMAYKLNDTNASLSGVLGTADTSVAMPTGIANFRLGSRPLDQQFNGWIRTFDYYNTRLADAALTALTA